MHVSDDRPFAATNTQLSHYNPGFQNPLEVFVEALAQQTGQRSGFAVDIPRGENISLDPVHALEVYVNRTVQLRPKEDTCMFDINNYSNSCLIANGYICNKN